MLKGSNRFELFLQLYLAVALGLLIVGIIMKHRMLGAIGGILLLLILAIAAICLMIAIPIWFREWLRRRGY